MFTKSLAAACAVVLFGGILASPAVAQPIDKRTFFTFSGPVAVPGVTLPAGKYLFRVTNPDTSANVVQVLSADGKTPYSMFHTVPARRPDAPRDPEIRFMETAAGMPAAVKTWWHPGNRDGYELVYPKQQARLLAKGTGRPILTTVAEAPFTPEPEFVRVAPSGEETRVTLQPAPEPVAGVGLEGEFAPPSIAVPESVQARATLPRTASPLPLVGGAGALLLLGAGLLAGLRRVVR
jgi:hypothetical protein